MKQNLFFWCAISMFLLFSFADINAQNSEMTTLPVKLYNDSGDSFVVIGHRGASAYYPENTMVAFRAAYEMGAEMVELDVLLSKDGVPVVIHDETLKRTTNGKGNVHDYTLAELKQLDAGSWFGKKFAGEKIPTLEEVIQFAKGTIALNIEIKTEAVRNDLHGGIEEKSLALVKKYDMQEHVLFSSFDFRAIEHLRELDGEIATALLYEKKQSKRKSPVQLSREYRSMAFNCSRKQLSEKWMDSLRESGIPVFIYTVNKEKEMKRLIDMGVSGIFSDKPDVLRQVADRHRD